VKTNATALLRLPDVLQRTGMSKSQIYRLTRSGEFPVGVRISPRCTCWPSDEIEAWIHSRISEARRIAS
jgi:prophage regulatory protein